MIETIINKYKNKSFLISYSGGLDSTVLLHQFLKIKKKVPQIKIRAIHINHNLTFHSKEWVQHCKNTCLIHKIPLIIENIHVDKNEKNLEEKLRIKRYTIIYKHLFLNEILLTGHHMNDQCETFFLSLKRGSGPTGLSGMSFKTILGSKTIIRPFLNTTKKTLSSWAYHKNLKWIEDFSNSNINYDRNFIRKKIIPVLEKKWPFFLNNCLRAMNICQEETALLKNLLHEKINNYIKFDGSLNVKTLKNMQKELATALIRHWISLKTIKMPSYKNIQCIYYQMLFSRKDANPKIILKTNEIRRYKDSLYFIKTQPSLKNQFLFWHDVNYRLTLPNTLGYLVQDKNGVALPKPKNNQLINIRFQYEDNILILGRNKKRKIKKIWQEKNIPPWLRNQIPLLFYNNIFVSALGVFVVNMNNIHKETWTITWKNDFFSKENCSFSFY
ncbi:tRNA lysidine(34) synthetase TilS [Buchnera aphidicola]|uniref:tRNA lysidine(34) synthetase TilS n=1 Tax=Buchnera aphidicola TaxID=9 RepID=UPI003464527F